MNLVMQIEGSQDDRNRKGSCGLLEVSKTNNGKWFA